MRLQLLLTVCCVSIALHGGVAAGTDAPAQPMIGEEAPDFTLATIKGDTLSLADLRGKFVVIHFGTSW